MLDEEVERSLRYAGSRLLGFAITQGNLSHATREGSARCCADCAPFDATVDS
jgi:hypothetical protein